MDRSPRRVLNLIMGMPRASAIFGEKGAYTNTADEAELRHCSALALRHNYKAAITAPHCERLNIDHLDFSSISPEKDYSLYNTSNGDTNAMSTLSREHTMERGALFHHHVLLSLPNVALTTILN